MNEHDQDDDRDGGPLGKTESVRDRGGIGAEGGDHADEERLPFEPSSDDDTPLGDTDQHSQVTGVPDMKPPP